MERLYNWKYIRGDVDRRSHNDTQLQMENPEPFLQDLHGKVISVMLKWGWELRGILQSKDEYMNLLVNILVVQLTNAEEVVNG